VAIGDLLVVDGAAGDVLCAQGGRERLCMLRAGGEEGEGDAAVAHRIWHLLQGDAGKILQAGYGSCLDGPALREDGIQPLSLCPDQGSGKLREAIVLAGDHIPIARLALAALPKAGRSIVLHTGPVIDRLIIGDEDASLAGGDDLVLLKAKATCIAKGAQRLAPVRAAIALSDILDDAQAVPASDRHDLIHARRHAPHVHGDHRACPGGDLALQILRVEVQRGVDLGDDRHSAHRDDGRSRRHKGIRRQDDLIPWANVDAHQGSDECAGAAVDRQRVLAAQSLAVPLLNVPRP